MRIRIILIHINNTADTGAQKCSTIRAISYKSYVTHDCGTRTGRIGTFIAGIFQPLFPEYLNGSNPATVYSESEFFLQKRHIQ